VGKYTTFDIVMMKRAYLLIVALLATSFAIGYGIGYLIKRPQKKISIFIDTIKGIADQKGISFEEAASMVYDLGYRGVDTWVTTSENDIRILDSIGFSHPCTIAIIDFCNGGECHEETESALAFMKQFSYDKLLLVPGCFPETPSREQKDSVITKVQTFSEKAADMGLTVLVEDFDDNCSPCMNSDDLDHFFAACPNLCHLYDSGNYPFCGEDEVQALQHFLPKTKHIHFKDRSSRDVKDMPAIGTGVVRFTEINEILKDGGYDGWITIEIASDNLYEDAEISIKNIK